MRVCLLRRPTLGCDIWIGMRGGLAGSRGGLRVAGVDLTIWIRPVGRESAAGGPCRVPMLIALVKTRESGLGDVSSVRHGVWSRWVVVVGSLPWFYRDGSVHGAV